MKTIKTQEKIKDETKTWIKNYKEYLYISNTHLNDCTIVEYIIEVLNEDVEESERIEKLIEEEDIEDIGEYIQIIIENAPLYF